MCFDLMNTNPQCGGCNIGGHGKNEGYGIRLVETHGLEAVQDLERRINERKNRKTLKKTYRFHTEEELYEMLAKLSTPGNPGNPLTDKLK